MKWNNVHNFQPNYSGLTACGEHKEGYCHQMEELSSLKAIPDRDLSLNLKKTKADKVEPRRIVSKYQ